jgi:hypothetical protein
VWAALGQGGGLSRPGGGGRMLFDPLRFEPAIDIAFTKEDLFLKFDIGNLPMFHQLIDGPSTDSQIFHKLTFGDEVVFHPGRILPRKPKKIKGKA